MMIRHCWAGTRILAIGSLAFVSTLFGQPPNPVTCQTNVAVTPTLRSNGYAELSGDLAFFCVGGVQPSVGAAVPTYNFTLFFNTAVTSRILGASNASEALLLIDEPGSGLAGPANPAPFGPQAPVTVCPTPATGCGEFVSSVTVGSSTVLVATNNAQGTNATVAGYNAFQGVVSGNTVTFFGVPVLQPGVTGFARTLRFTNLRVNATALGLGVSVPVIPTCSISPVTGGQPILIPNATPTTAFVQNGLNTTVSGAVSTSQSVAANKLPIGLLTFSEPFSTAFKTRVQPASNTVNAGQGTQPQNVPGFIYNTESDLMFAAGGGTAGQADFGTRLKAQFNNLPAGVHLFVSVTNVNSASSPVTPPAVIGGTSTTSFAQLTSSETGAFSAVAATDTASSVPIAEIPVTNGAATAVWEVVNTNINANETVNFAVYATYASNPGLNSPPPGTATVNLSFAPSPPAFSAASAATASDSLPVPRFIADPGAPQNLLTISPAGAGTSPAAGAAAGAPTLSEWAITLLACGLVYIAARRLRRARNW